MKGKAEKVWAHSMVQPDSSISWSAPTHTHHSLNHFSHTHALFLPTSMPYYPHCHSSLPSGSWSILCRRRRPGINLWQQSELHYAYFCVWQRYEAYAKYMQERREDGTNGMNVMACPVIWVQFVLFFSLILRDSSRSNIFIVPYVLTAHAYIVAAPCSALCSAYI